jgi:hypothetical protein
VRPTAVRVIVAILLAQAAVAVLATLLVPSVPALTPLLGPATALLVATLVEPSAGDVAVVGLAVNAVWVAVAVLLWRRRGGARVALGVLGGAGVLLALTYLLSAEPLEAVAFAVTAAGTVAALALLGRREVRDWYRRAG